MSRSRSVRAVLSRTVVVLVVVSGVLVGMAGSSLAVADEGGPVSAGSVPSGADIAGVSIGTFSWAIAGFLLLVLGFIAASRSGRNLPADGRPGVATGTRVSQSSRGQQGESTSTAVAV